MLSDTRRPPPARGPLAGIALAMRLRMTMPDDIWNAAVEQVLRALDGRVSRAGVSERGGLVTLRDDVALRLRGLPSQTLDAVGSS